MSSLPLRAGPLTCVFDPVLGAVRYIRFGQRELVRSVYGAVRDRSWNTVAPRVHSIEQHDDRAGTTLTYRAEAAQGDVAFAWTGRVECGDEGTLRITFDGEALTMFWRNRIGLCVLHPLDECAGQACTVTTSTGVVHGRFPTLASPHQVFVDMAEVEYDAGQGCRVRVGLEGDTFEMEDQRNWGDASFKTYSTPLSEPMPVEVLAGTRIRQAVTISLLGQPSARVGVSGARHDAGPRRVHVGGGVRPVPGVGLNVASHGQPLTARESGRLRALGLTHLRTEVRFGDADWEASFARAQAAASVVGVPLQVALLLSEDHEPEAAGFLERPERANGVALWLVLQPHAPCTTQAAARHLAAQLSAATPGVPVAVGTAHNFAELNRNRDILTGPWWPSYALSPLTHLPDTLTLIENIGAQGDMVRTARSFSPHPVVVGPVGLRSHRASTDAAHGGLPATVDPRQPSLLAAGWTVGSLNQLLRAEGLHSVSYYETTGWRGVLECDEPPTTHHDFPSRPGMAFPLYHVFADLAGSSATREVEISDALEVAALAVLRRDGGTRLLVANLTPDALEVVVSGLSGPVRGRMLDDSTYARATTDPEAFAAERGNPIDPSSPLAIGPWAVARLDEGSGTRP